MDENLRLGQRVSMMCSVTDGDLPITLRWLRDDRVLPIGSTQGITITPIGQYESVLRIDDLRPEHNANFSCIAENYAGSAQHSQLLRVKGTTRLLNHRHCTFAPRLYSRTTAHASSTLYLFKVSFQHLQVFRGIFHRSAPNLNRTRLLVRSLPFPEL